MGKNRIALVLGGSGGIGQAIVEKLAAQNYSVAVHYSGNKEKAESLVHRVKKNEGIKAISLYGDVADEADMERVFNETETSLGKIDVVINTAGIMLLSPIASIDLDDLDRMHRINIRGTFVVSKLAAQKVQSGGAIIHFSTSVTRTQFPAYGAYAASKAAVESMILILAKELKGKNITVNAVAPGPTATPLFLNGKDETAIENLAQAAPLERLGEPEDIAETTAFLAGPGRWVNGQIIFANGGMA